MPKSYKNIVCLKIGLAYQLESVSFYRQKLQLVLKDKANQMMILDQYELCKFAAQDMVDKEEFFCTIGME